ncbi:MAG: hypothetical protein ACI4RA_05240 [Kiritimatiellia bacterium]
MKKLMSIVAAVTVVAMILGCASSGLSDAAKENVPTTIWYDNANLLVEANDPDLKADTFIGVPALDAVVDSVKDVLAQVPAWTVAKVEQKHFDNMYMESAKALNGGADGADLIVKGEAFKTALMMDTFAEEVAHAKAAIGLPREERKANHAKNAEVYEAAGAKVIDYANNQILVFETCADDAARKAFFADSGRAVWNARMDEIVAKVKACVAKADDEAAAKAGIAKLCKEMGVEEYDWNEVAARLVADLEKVQKAIQDLAQAMQTDAELQQKIAMAAFGGEIVPGTSGKETLAVIQRFSKQLAVNAKLIAWLIKSLAV